MPCPPIRAKIAVPQMPPRSEHAARLSHLASIGEARATGKLRWNMHHNVRGVYLEQEWEVATYNGVVKEWRTVPNAWDAVE